MKENFKRIWRITHTEYLYELQVQQLIDEGMSRSDAQGIVDAREMAIDTDPSLADTPL